jgi:hypothetical protein
MEHGGRKLGGLGGEAGWKGGREGWETGIGGFGASEGVDGALVKLRHHQVCDASDQERDAAQQHPPLRTTHAPRDPGAFTLCPRGFCFF